MMYVKSNEERDYMQKVIDAIKAKKLQFVMIGLTFLIASLYNMLSPYTTDDYAYMFSAVTGDKITDVFQILESLWDDYLHVHGRIVPHFFLQLFMIGPKWIFNLVNAGMFTYMIWLVLTIGEKKRKFYFLLWLAVPVALWSYLPAYGQVFLWMSGSVNYCWAFVFALLFIRFYIRLYQNPDEIINAKQMAGLCVYGLFFGAYSELVSFPIVFTSFFLLCLVMYKKHTIKKYWKYLLPIVVAAVGYLTMLLSPAQQSRQADDVSAGAVIKRFISVFEVYYDAFDTLLITWAVLLAISVCYKINKKQLIISVSFMLISILSMSLLSVTSYIAARHYAVNAFFIIVAIVILLRAGLEQENIRCVTYCICAYVLVSSIWCLWEGTYDIYSVYQQHGWREEYIYSEIEKGNDEVLYVPLITSQTKYSCKYDLIDLQTDSTYTWPNSAIAKYYGIQEIYGMH